MKKFYRCKLYVIIFGALLAAQGVVASTTLSCTVHHFYFSDGKKTGQLYAPPENIYRGDRFVVNRITGEIRGIAGDMRNSYNFSEDSGWKKIVSSTGNFNGDWGATFIYQGQQKELLEPEVVEVQVVRRTVILSLNIAYSGPDKVYRDLDQDKKTTFKLSESYKTKTGICQPLQLLIGKGYGKSDIKVDFILDNIFEILIGVAVAFYIFRTFATHKTIDQRMEETINDPKFDPMAYHERKQVERAQRAAREAEIDE